MPPLADILRHSASLHRHLCPRQVLGARMGIAAGAALGVPLPQTRARLYIFVETDGCFADGISAATGCTLGHRTMRLVDLGKVAMTAVEMGTPRAVRVSAHPGARVRAEAVSPRARSRWHAQLEAYQRMPDIELLNVQPVMLTLSLTDILSRPRARVTCEACGEEVINAREVRVGGRILCRPCAGEAYYRCVS